MPRKKSKFYIINFIDLRIIFLKIKNAFLSYIWLSKCFFLFLFYILITFLFYMLFDNGLMKTYSLCGRRGAKEAFKETKICGVIASKWILFIYRFFLLSQKMNRVSYPPFPFYITYHKKIKVLKTVWN